MRVLMGVQLPLVSDDGGKTKESVVGCFELGGEGVVDSDQAVLQCLRGQGRRKGGFPDLEGAVCEMA